ncbi:PQQ-binding-like beta-propeller repeat protein [Planctomicrobium sp. SH668]|uniref:PQQ-binding-like beta-propeller repeat protein n=1 Tax=Planctomicrobium sp. SH668 TaxID=3448126 RepID=UPI003F5AEE76
MRQCLEISQRTLLGVLVLWCVVAPTAAISGERSEEYLRNWPHWRGPNADGTVVVGDPPLKWSEAENLRWKIQVPGRGSATPIVWNSRVYVVSAVPTGKEAPPLEASGDRAPRGGGEAASEFYEFTVFCYQLQTGELLWKQIATTGVPHESGHPTNSFASGSPVTDGERLYVTFGSHGIYCYDLDGNIIWTRQLGKMQTRRGFGEGGSPAVWGETLVVPWDHEGQSRIYSLNALTGEINWQQDRDEVTTWDTPLIVPYEDRVQVVMNATNRTRSYDLHTGEVIWECGGQATNAIASPIVYGDLAICMTGYNGFAVYAIPLSSKGDVTETDQISWKRNDAGPYISSPVISNGSLFFTKSKDAILFSVDAATGEPQIRGKRMPQMGTLYASPIAVKDRLYYCDRSGTCLVVKAADEFEVLETNRLDEVIDASPVVVGNKLIIRGEKSLYCIEEDSVAEISQEN